jgi:hypothetical protein
VKHRCHEAVQSGADCANGIGRSASRSEFRQAGFSSTGGARSAFQPLKFFRHGVYDLNQRASGKVLTSLRHSCQPREAVVSHNNLDRHICQRCGPDIQIGIAGDEFRNDNGNSVLRCVIRIWP